MPFQFCGGWVTKSGRYQSNWVLVVTGAAYSLCFQRAVASGPGRVSTVASASAWPAGSSDSGSAQPASANSAVHTTSSAITSKVRSLTGQPAGQLQSLLVRGPGQADC